MKKIFIFVLPLALVLSSCRLQRVVNPSESPSLESSAAATATLTELSSPPPTQTVVPTATITPIPTPDLTLVGLPTEPAGTTAFDFVETMCKAQWFTQLGDLPCPGKDSQADSGYVMQLDGEVQGLPSNFNVLLAFPPDKSVESIFSKYPTFTVKKGDRFRAVLACRAHSFCDVDFSLNYFDERGQNSLKNWRYLFTDSPIVVDYSLDGLAGKTVQFNLAVHADGARMDAYALWIAPHIYRPIP
ncbi:MAG TPA: hypothetical protein VHM28_06130 [Anaerolineales bacterium]|jgi:hypothetical protein|nr:hypothetical protein [Anaerolineales bacterium]